MKRTQIQLTEEQTERLDQVAREEGVSRSEVIRRAIDLWLGARSSTVSSGEKRKQAKEIVGTFSSGTDDVSKHHDDYLEEEYRS